MIIAVQSVEYQSAGRAVVEATALLTSREIDRAASLREYIQRRLDEKTTQFIEALPGAALQRLLVGEPLRLTKMKLRLLSLFGKSLALTKVFRGEILEYTLSGVIEVGSKQRVEKIADDMRKLAGLDVGVQTCPRCRQRVFSQGTQLVDHDDSDGKPCVKK